jgi:hypothetical protein
MSASKKPPPDGEGFLFARKGLRTQQDYLVFRNRTQCVPIRLPDGCPSTGF